MSGMYSVKGNLPNVRNSTIITHTHITIIQWGLVRSLRGRHRILMLGGQSGVYKLDTTYPSDGPATLEKQNYLQTKAIFYCVQAMTGHPTAPIHHSPGAQGGMRNSSPTYLVTAPRHTPLAVP